MNFKDIIKKELLFEMKKESGTLKIFYDIDIKIKNEIAKVVEPVPEVPIEPVPETPVAPVPETPVVPVTETPVAPKVLPVKESINEEDEPIETVAPGKDIIKKIEGVIALSKEEIDNIMTIDDILDVLGDKKHKGEDLLDDLTIETVLSLIGNPEAMKSPDLIKKNDQIIINLNFGYKKEDSVGIKILKRKGVNSVSIMLIKDNAIIDAPFDVKKFNNQITEYRNDYTEK